VRSKDPEPDSEKDALDAGDRMMMRVGYVKGTAGPEEPKAEGR
jgi:hypothetical protein